MMRENNILSFLNMLAVNNDREWFALHKDEYLKAKSEMELLVSELIGNLGQYDHSIATQEAKNCLFRIYRDIRFSKNKDPYKTNMGAYVVPGGKKSGRAGYYIHLEPGASFLAGGIHRPDLQTLNAVRQEIVYHTDEFLSLLDNKEFQTTFGSIYGEKLKRPPKGFSPEFKEIELLKYKSFAVVSPISDELINSGIFIQEIIKVFRLTTPLNAFINRVFD